MQNARYGPLSCLLNINKKSKWNRLHLRAIRRKGEIIKSLAYSSNSADRLRPKPRPNFYLTNSVSQPIGLG